MKKPIQTHKFKPVNISPRVNLWFKCSRVGDYSVGVAKGSVFFFDGQDRFLDSPPTESSGKQLFIPAETIEIPEDLREGFTIYCKIILSPAYSNMLSQTILADSNGVENTDEDYDLLLSRFGKYSTISPSGDDFEDLHSSLYEYEVFSDGNLLPAKTDFDNSSATEYVYIPICRGSSSGSRISFRQLFAGVFVINRQQYHYGTDL
jgi:hypothetical protein